MPQSPWALPASVRPLAYSRAAYSSQPRHPRRLRRVLLWCRRPSEIGPTCRGHHDQSDHRGAGRVKPKSGTSRGRLWDDLDVPLLFCAEPTMGQANKRMRDVSTALWDVCKRPENSRRVNQPTLIVNPAPLERGGPRALVVTANM